jgi:integrase
LSFFLRYQSDYELEAITPSMLSGYMSYLRNEYKPHRPSKDSSPLSLSALDNHWKCLRAFFGWCNRVLELKRPDLRLPRQRFTLPEVTPLTESEVKALLNACEHTKTATTAIRKPFSMRRPSATRDKALLLVLLDTGLRVGEVTRLQVKDINMSNGEIHVKPYGSGQKTKPRTVYLGKAARRTMWMYLSSLEGQRNEDPDDEVYRPLPGAIYHKYRPSHGHRAGS